MKTHLRRLAIACLAGLCFAVAGKAQDAPRKKPAPEALPARAGTRATGMSPEEKLVRAAYEKLTMLNRAARHLQGGAVTESPDDSQVLKFELSNFRVGPINEIWGALHSEIKTLPTGEIIQLSRSRTSLNRGPEHVAYKAEWVEGQYATLYDRQWTVGDLFGFDPGRYHDVGGYASYEVTVSFSGKSRTYRALALFHNPYGSVENLKPDFWDSVVGLGGALTQVWNEKLPPVDEKVSPPIKKGSPPAAPGLSLPPPSLDHPGGGAAAQATESYSANIAVSDVVEGTTEDRKEHITGAHGQRVGFQGSCAGQSNNEQVCRVEIVHKFTYETGKIRNRLYTHRNMVDEKNETGTGPRGVVITCTAARGVATSNCLDHECTFSASLQGTGVSVSMTGGDVWNGQLAHKHTCNLPAPTPTQAACSGTPDFFGNCPAGYTNNGCNTCCSDQARDDCSASGGHFNQVDGYCRDPASMCWDQQYECVNPGQYWNEFACGCAGPCTVYSPVLVDVQGDGFSLTNMAGGVRFDLDGDGAREQLSWTSANSDDAWLAFDRDGDGAITKGAELFGNFTYQPGAAAGAERHGFLALAEFDRAAGDGNGGYGGNGDGVIDNRDAVFNSLRLWRDANHDGVSEPGELHTLQQLGLKSIDLDYKESRRVDEHGNQFRYRAKVKNVRGAQLGRWAWDVFLVRAP